MKKMKIILFGLVSLVAINSSARTATESVIAPNFAVIAGKALIEAAYQGQLEKLKKLIAVGADLNTQTNFFSEKNRLNETALMIAAKKGHTKIAKALIDAGADVNATDIHGITALINAACKGHTKIAKALLARYAYIDTRLSDGGTALMCAALNGKTETVKVLLAAGADINIQSGGATALDIAKNNHRKDIIDLLSPPSKL